MITRSSFCRKIRQERIMGKWGMVPGMHVRDNQINIILTTCFVVDKLAELGREEEDVVWLVAIKISKKQELCLREFHLEKIVIHGDVVRQYSLLSGVWFRVDSTDNEELQITFELGSNLDPNYF